MTAKFGFAKQCARAAVAAYDKVDIAWTAFTTVNTVIFWGAHFLLSPANDVQAAEATLMQPKVTIATPAEPAQKLELLVAPQAADPSLAVWGYLCGRNGALGDAAGKRCPATAELFWERNEQTEQFDPPARSDPFAWNERLNAANDNHHIVEE